MMYGYKILLFAALVLPVFAVPLQGYTILQKDAVVERSDDPVGATILPSLPKREPIIDLVERAIRIGGGGFGPPKRSLEEVEKRKNRFNGGGFGNPKRRSDSLETRGITRPVGGWEAPPSDDRLETRAKNRTGQGWDNGSQGSHEARQEASDDGDLLDEVDVDAFGFGGSKRGLRGTGGSGGHKRGLQRPGKGGGGKRGLKCPGSGGSKRGLTPACGGSK